MTAITELRRNYKLAALLELAGIPRSTYYYHCKKAQSGDKYKHEKAEITAIYKENQGRYGYRRILMELRNRGYILNHKTVQKLMKELGLKCVSVGNSKPYFVGSNEPISAGKLKANRQKL